jgi:hypothetical protein
MINYNEEYLNNLKFLYNLIHKLEREVIDNFDNIKAEVENAIKERMDPYPPTFEEYKFLEPKYEEIKSAKLSKPKIEYNLVGYGKILYISIQDPMFLPRWQEREKGVEFFIYISSQKSKPISLSQMSYKLRNIYYFVDKLTKNPSRYIILLAPKVSDKVKAILSNFKANKIYVFSTVDEVVTFMAQKYLERLDKYVSNLKYRGKYLLLVKYFEKIINVLGFEVPQSIKTKVSMLPFTRPPIKSKMQLRALSKAQAELMDYNYQLHLYEVEDKIEKLKQYMSSKYYHRVLSSFKNEISKSVMKLRLMFTDDEDEKKELKQEINQLDSIFSNYMTVL